MSNDSRSPRRSEKTQVREVMNSSVPSLPPSATAEQAQSLLERENSRYLLIMEGDDVMGIISGSDLEGTHRDTVVSSCMRVPVLGICERASVDEAARIMSDTGFGCLPVFWPDGRLLGLVTRDEVHDAIH